MVTREDIVAEVQKVPGKYLEEIYKIIKDFERKDEESSRSVMAQLRQIKISATDFSVKADLYDLETKND
jgi:hypothetical protein